MSKKSIISLVIIMSLMLAMVVVPASAEEWPLSVRVNDEEVIFPDAVPFIDANGRTQVPVRFVSEALSATVEWINETRQVVIVKEDKTITLTIGKKEMTINGQTKVLDSAPLIKEGRTFVPVRFVSEGLGAKVDWEAITRTVFIDTTGSSATEEIEKVQANEIKIKGYSLHVEQGDDAAKYAGTVTIVKKCGITISEDSADSGDLILSIKRLPTTDYNSVKTVLKEILSQKYSAASIEKVISIIDNNKDKKDVFVVEKIEESQNKIDVLMAGEGDITIYLY